MCSIYLDSYTQTQSPPSSAHSIDDKSEIYCICLNEKDGKFIGCENKTNCNSYIERKQALGVEGGDWFHMECLNIKSFPKKNGFVAIAKMWSQLQHSNLRACLKGN